MGRGSAVLVGVIALAAMSCGAADEEPTVAADVPTGTSPPTSTPASTPTTEPTTRAPTRVVDPSNAAAVERGTQLLRNGGVRGVGEAEPAHGDRDAELTGRWGDRVVVAHVAPRDQDSVAGEVVAVDSVAGQRVETIAFASRPTPVLRFDYGDHVVDLQVLTDDYRTFLRTESLELLAVILCPSECGDLPPGADE